MNTKLIIGVLTAAVTIIDIAIDIVHSASDNQTR